MSAAPSPLERVRNELLRYEHPLVDFAAREREEGAVVLLIQVKNPPPGVHTYEADLHSRDLMGSQFTWTFQRILYDCLHDYLVELFIRTPQGAD